MEFIIKKGKHRPAWWWLRWPVFYNRTNIGASFKFSSSCKYDLRSADQQDVNKLFGIGFFPHHRLESARIGWRFDGIKRMIVLSAYAYVDGKRIIQDIDDISIDVEYIAVISVRKNRYEFKVARPDEGEIYITSIVKIPKTHNIKFSYPLGLYFGGNQRAPHDMVIELTRKLYDQQANVLR